MVSNIIEILIQGQDQASAVIDQVTQNSESAFGKLTDSMVVSGAAMTALVAPAGALFTSAINSAANFEEAMANAQSILGATKDETAELSAEVLALGRNSRAGPQAAAESFYAIVSGVADASTHMAILDSSIRTAEAGGAELAGTTSALIAVMNSYGFAAEDAGFASDVLTNIVGKGVGTMDQFASALPQVTGLANTMGISLDELGGEMALITTKGFQASEAATQLKALMSSMLNPSADLQKALEGIGYESGAAAVEALGLQGTVQALADEYGSGADLASIFGSSIEATNAALTLAGEGADTFVTNFQNSVEGATDAAQAIQLDSFNAQWDLMKSQISAVSITLGSALLPVLNDLLGSIMPIVESVGDWIGSNPALIRTVGGIVAAVGGFGTALVGAGGGLKLIQGLLTKTNPAFLAVSAVIWAVKTNFLGIGDVFNEVVGAIEYGIAVFQAQMSFGAGIAESFARAVANTVAYVGLAFGLLSNETVDAFAEQWADKLAGVATTVQSVFQTVIPAAIDFVTTAWTTILQPAIAAVGDYITGSFIPTALLLADFLGTVIPIAISAAAGFWNSTLKPALAGVWQFIVGNVVPALSSIYDWFSANLPTAIDGLVNVWDTALKPALEWAWEFISGTLAPIIATFISTEIEGLKIGIGLLSDAWSVILRPALEWTWAFLTNSIIPIMTDVGGVIVDVLIAAVDGAKIAFDFLWPIIETVGVFLADQFSAGIDTATGAFETFKGIVEDVYGWLSDLYDKINGVVGALGSISIPDIGLPDLGGFPTFGLFDSGGRIGAGEPGLIGTGAQPELFVPDRSGTMYPAGSYDLGGGGDTNIYVSVDSATVNDTANTQANAQVLGDSLERELRKKGII